MDENESAELAQQMEDSSVLGHMTEDKTVQSRKGRGFKYNTQTGKYIAL